MMSNNEPVSQKKEPNAFGASMTACFEQCMPGRVPEDKHEAEQQPGMVRGPSDMSTAVGACCDGKDCGCSMTPAAEAAPVPPIVRQRRRKGNAGPRPAREE